MTITTLILLISIPLVLIFVGICTGVVVYRYGINTGLRLRYAQQFDIPSLDDERHNDLPDHTGAD